MYQKYQNRNKETVYFFPKYQNSNKVTIHCSTYISIKTVIKYKFTEHFLRVIDYKKATVGFCGCTRLPKIKTTIDVTVALHPFRLEQIYFYSVRYQKARTFRVNNLRQGT
jgi:hypothetical protein